MLKKGAQARSNMLSRNCVYKGFGLKYSARFDMP